MWVECWSQTFIKSVSPSSWAQHSTPKFSETSFWFTRRDPKLLTVCLKNSTINWRKWFRGYLRVTFSKILKLWKSFMSRVWMNLFDWMRDWSSRNSWSLTNIKKNTSLNQLHRKWDNFWSQNPSTYNKNLSINVKLCSTSSIFNWTTFHKSFSLNNSNRISKSRKDAWFSSDNSAITKNTIQ